MGYSVFKFSGHINCPILKWKKLIILYQEVATATCIYYREGRAVEKESPREESSLCPKNFVPYYFASDKF